MAQRSTNADRSSTGQVQARGTHPPPDLGEDLTGRVHVADFFVEASGGFGVVFKGTYTPNQSKPESYWYVAVKGFKDYPRDENDLQGGRPLAGVARELYLANEMKGLQHEHLLSFLGIVCINARWHLVAPWMENGNALQYIAKYPDTDLFKMLKEIAAGLHYLHTRSPKTVVHGDLKPENVVIDDGGSARLCDFGLSRHVNWDLALQNSTESMHQGTWIYRAPERIFPELFNLSMAAAWVWPIDVYAFGLVIYQLYTRQAPFLGDFASAGLRKQELIGQAIGSGVRPITSSEWDHPGMAQMRQIMVDCWQHYPSARPTMAVVIQRMRAIQNPPRLPLPPAPVRTEMGGPPAHRHRFSEPGQVNQSYRAMDPRTVRVQNQHPQPYSVSAASPINQQYTSEPHEYEEMDYEDQVDQGYADDSDEDSSVNPQNPVSQPYYASGSGGYQPHSAPSQLHQWQGHPGGSSGQRPAAGQYQPPYSRTG